MSSNSEMTFLEHVSELRYRVLRVILCLFLFTFIGFYFSSNILDLLIKPISGIIEKSEVGLQISKPTSIFITKISIGLFFSFIFSMPVMLYEIFIFLLPAFDKKIILSKAYFFILVAVFFFISGLIFSYYILVPISLDFFNHMTMNFIDSSKYGIAMIQLFNYNDYILYLLRMSFVAGLVFQLPVIVNVLVFMNIVKISTLKKLRRYLYLIFFIIAAILTPPDIPTQLLIAVPSIFLYELSILIASIFKNEK